jgi:hypothetical protein
MFQFILHKVYVRFSTAEWLRPLASNHVHLTAVGSNPESDFGLFHVRTLSS